jgi:hypothetical protein
MTNAVRVFCAIIDLAILTGAAVALVRWHRAGMVRVRGIGKPVPEPTSNVGVVVSLMEWQNSKGGLIHKIETTTRYRSHTP